MADFDVEGALKAGYSPTEVVDFLAKDSGFDVQGARKAGYTDQELIPHLRPSSAAPVSNVSNTDRFLQGMKDPIDGGAQLLTHILPSSVVEKGNQLNNWLADKTGIVGKLPEGGVDQQVKEIDAKFKTDGFDGYRMLGNVASPANLAIASKIPAAGSLMNRAVAGGAGGVMSGMLSPVASDDYAGEKQKQMTVSGGVGTALPVVGNAVSRVISPKASVNPDVQLLRSEGVNPTIGQTLGGWANKLEEKLQSVPFMGDAISSMRNSSREDLNRAAINRAVAPIGAKVDKVGQEGVKEAGDLLSGAYQKALDNLSFVKFDKNFANDLTQLQSMASGLEPKFQDKFNKVLADRFGSRLSGNGSMLGDAYKKVYSDIGKDAATFSGMENAAARDYGSALKQLQNLMNQQVTRGGNPEAAKLMAAADKGYANLVRVEGAAKAAMNSDGVFTPAQLNMAVRQADTSVRDRATARGTALMQDLSGAGQNVLGNKVPNSGTIDRGLAVGLGGAAIADPVITGSVLASGILGYSPLAQKLMTAAVANRPQAAQPIAEGMKKAFPFLIPVGSGLLNN